MSQKERILTEKEKVRKNRIDKLTEELSLKGYVRKDRIIDIVFANVMAIVLAVPFIVLFGFWFFSKNGKNLDISLSGIVYVWIAFIVLIVVHEGIHGLTWGLCSKSKFKNIEFGFMVSKLTPYCYCGDPLKKGAYILGSVMPCLVLGIIPCIISVYINSFYLLLIAVVMIIGAGGDLMVILKMLFLRSSANDIIIMDHPTECGFITFER